MLSYLYPLVYGIVVIVLLWQAFRVMKIGFLSKKDIVHMGRKRNNVNDDRTGQLTVHPELLDTDGRITSEELLTVRFSQDFDPPQSAEETSAE